MNTTPGDAAANFGKGPFTGLAGTAAMTVSSTLDILCGNERMRLPSCAGSSSGQSRPV